MNKHNTLFVVFLLALAISAAVARIIKPDNIFNQDEEFTVTIRRSDAKEAAFGNLYHLYTDYMRNYSLATAGRVERSVTQDAPAASIDWDKVKNIGKEIWDVIVKNQPTFDVKNATSGNVVPAGITDWRQLTHWKRPVSVPYTVEYKNFVGMTVINFQFQVVFIPGGKYQNKGNFLTGISVIPTNIEVTWSYHFGCRVDIPQVWNAGESSDDPIGAAQINLSFDFDGKQKKVRSWAIKGTGEIDELN